MSDDEDVRYVKRQKVVHFGSLAETMAGEAKAKAADGDGNVHRSDEYMAFDQESSIMDSVALEQNEMLAELERRKRARLINVSTDDAEVRFWEELLNETRRTVINVLFQVLKILMCTTCRIRFIFIAKNTHHHNILISFRLKRIFAHLTNQSVSSEKDLQTEETDFG
jgi:hypothetical protein